MSDGPFNLLAWQISVGADEAISETPVDHTAARPVPPPAAAAPARRPAGAGHAAAPAASPSWTSPSSASSSSASLRARLAACESVEALREALLGFDECALKAAATTTVFADGTPGAPLMLIGDAPGADEDRQGLPFVGETGRLLDRMLGAIGLDRSGVFLTNTIYWRLPAKRRPTPQEIGQCRPFVERLIALARPRIIVALGDTAAKSLLDSSDGITILRGRWGEFHNPSDDRKTIAISTFHPFNLLQSPALKRDAWKDLRAIAEKLSTP